MPTLQCSVSFAPFQSVRVHGVEHLLHYQRADHAWTTYDNEVLVYEEEAECLPATHAFEGELLETPRYFVRLTDGLMPLANMPAAVARGHDTSGFVELDGTQFVWDLERQTLSHGADTYHLYVMTGRGRWL